MRLFVAVNFEEDIKRGLDEYKCILRESSLSGSFTLCENFHLTLAFIGETEKVAEIKEVIGKIKYKPFEITAGGIGSFENKRGRGTIYYIPILQSSDLQALHSLVLEHLKTAGITIGEKRYTPHLTLGREVILKEKFNIKELENKIAPFTVSVNEISLMKSERIGGKLTYTQILKNRLTK